MKVIRSFGIAAVFIAAAILCGACGNQAPQSAENEAQSAALESEMQSVAPESATEEPAEDVEEAKSIEEIYQAIGKEVELQSPASMDDEFIENYYGMDTSLLEEYVFSMSEDAAQAETIIIMKVKDRNDMAGIKECLQMVLEEKKNEMEDYIPEQFAIVDKSKVVEKDNYIWLVISENAEAITDIIEGGLF